MIPILLISMLFCHVIDDYVLQDKLANLKQKKWWEKELKKVNPKARLSSTIYKNDYKMALLCHGFEWSFMIHLPLLLLMFKVGIDTEFVVFYTISIIINTVMHSIIDDIKANDLIINLVTDQIFHFVQVILTLILFCMINGWNYL